MNYFVLRIELNLEKKIILIALFKLSLKHSTKWLHFFAFKIYMNFCLTYLRVWIYGNY